MHQTGWHPCRICSWHFRHWLGCRRCRILHHIGWLASERALRTFGNLEVWPNMGLSMIIDRHHGLVSNYMSFSCAVLSLRYRLGYKRMLEEVKDAVDISHSHLTRHFGIGTGLTVINKLPVRICSLLSLINISFERY